MFYQSNCKVPKIYSKRILLKIRFKLVKIFLRTASIAEGKVEMNIAMTNVISDSVDLTSGEPSLVLE